MRILEEIQETVSVTVIRDVLCNKCGESCRIEGSPEGLIEAKVIGGFYAKGPIEDATTYHFSLCCRCLGDLFGLFSIPPEKHEYNLCDSSANDGYVEAVWRE